MSVWNSFGSGAWSNAANWIGGVPDATGATADFSNLASASLTHHIDLADLGPFTVGTLALASSSVEKYSLENGTLIMSQATGAEINVDSTGTPLASVLASSMTLQLNSNTWVKTTGASTVLDNQAQITGVGLLTKIGAGTLKLSDATSNWSGGTHIAAGAIDFSAAAFGSGDISFSGNSALRGSANVTLANDIIAASGVSATIKAATGTNLTLAGSFAALGGVGTSLHFGSASDNGTVVFASSSLGIVNGGDLSVDGGTLKAGAAFGSLTDHSASISLAAGATLDASGFFLYLNHLTGSGHVTNSGPAGIVVNLGETGTATYSGYFSDGAALISINKIGAGTLTLDGVNNYTGDTTVGFGTLRAGVYNAVSTKGILTVSNGATFNLGAYNQTVGGLDGSGEIRADTATSATLTISVALNSVQDFSGMISDGSAVFGDLRLIKFGDGEQKLSGLNSYTGYTQIHAGTLALVGAGSIEDSAFLTIFFGGALDIGGITGSTAFLQQLGSAGVVNLGGKTLNLTHQFTSTSGTFNGSGGTDSLVVNLDAATPDFSLSGAIFGTWTDAVDKITIKGNGLANALTGSSHADAIDGGTGIDTMTGLGGNDTYYVDNASDKVVEGAGQGTLDWVATSVNYSLGAGVQVEKLSTTTSGGTTAINLTGNAFVQSITGNAGDNKLDGKAGADTMTGLGGNDTYYVDNASDKVVEGAGQGTLDWVATSVNYVLGGGVQVEKLSTTSSGAATAINLTGNEFIQTITGNAGDNKIDGKAGADTMSGLGGNDTYYVDNAGDKIVEGVGQGTLDWVATSVSYALAAGVQVEKLSTTSSGGLTAISLTGNEFAQIVVGNAGDNTINGRGGNDTLTGGAGANSFVFDTTLNASTNVDTITDFNVAADTIRLENAIFTAITGTGTLTAAQFVKNTTGLAGDANDHIIYETDTGKLFYDSNGSAVGGSFHFATLTAGLALTNADFFVI